MKNHTIEELCHYDRKYSSKNGVWHYDNLFKSADNAFYELINNIIDQKGICKILDLGCGDGFRTRFLSKNPNVHLVGIDISKEGIKIARDKKIGNAEYLMMDVEQLSFKKHTFDLIIDYGSFSSFNMNYIWPKLKKIIKPNGILVGIETLGENPLFNMKRKFNIKKKIRTKNLETKILTLNQVFIWSKDCKNFTFKTFGFTSVFLSPLVLFFDNSFINYCIKLADKLDENFFMRFRMFQRLSFKVLFQYKF